LDTAEFDTVEFWRVARWGLRILKNPTKGTNISIGNTSEPTIHFQGNYVDVFWGVHPSILEVGCLTSEVERERQIKPNCSWRGWEGV